MGMLLQNVENGGMVLEWIACWFDEFEKRKKLLAQKKKVLAHVLRRIATEEESMRLLILGGWANVAGVEKRFAQEKRQRERELREKLLLGAQTTIQRLHQRLA